MSLQQVLALTPTKTLPHKEPHLLNSAIVDLDNPKSSETLETPEAPGALETRHSRDNIDTTNNIGGAGGSVDPTMVCPEKVLKLSFQNFWRSFTPSNNVFTRLLSQQYDQIIIDDNEPDILFYSCFRHGKPLKDFQKIYPKALIIFYTGENKRPDFDRCDLSLTFDWSKNLKNYRLPLYFMRKERILTAAGLRLPGTGQQILAQKKGFCCFLVSNRRGHQRNKLFHKLSEYKQVDSGGRFLNNIGYMVPKSQLATNDWIRGYKFMICFENSEYPGYTTEKLPNTYIAGTVGIYWGNPLVKRDFNRKAFLSYHEEGSTKDLIKRVIDLDHDDEKYLAMLREPLFRNNKLPIQLQDKNVSDFIRNGLKQKNKIGSQTPRVSRQTQAMNKRRTKNKNKKGNKKKMS